MTHPRIHNQSGTLTPYGFACGYIERREYGTMTYPVAIASPPFTTTAPRFAATLYLSSGRVVRRVDYARGGVVSREVFQRLTDARRAYRAAVAWARREAAQAERE